MSSKSADRSTGRPTTTAPLEPSRRPWSLAARLTAWYAGSAFALVLAATGLLYWALTTNLDREDDGTLAHKVHVLRLVLHHRPEDATALRQETEWAWEAGQHAPVYVRLLDEDGAVLVETPGMSAAVPAAIFPAPAPEDAEPGKGVSYRSPAGKSFRVLAARATLGTPEQPTRTIQVALDRSTEEALLAGYRRDLCLVLGGALAVCTAGGYLIARRGLRPVAEITATARRIRAATLAERLSTAGLPAELRTLADTFNGMLDRLEDSFARLARFSADIAHELRTPVNNLRGVMEVALSRLRSPDQYREVLGSCLEECVGLTDLIDSLLFLASAEDPRHQIAREPVEVGRELTEVQEFYEAAATEAGVRLTVSVAEPVRAEVNRPLLRRAVGNLVANALAHTEAGGIITLTAARDGEGVRVEVADTGCGIPESHLPHVFDRFYRVDDARSTGSGGVGLGLAIVKSIAELHGGSVRIASAVRQGTRVMLHFPAVRVS